MLRQAGGKLHAGGQAACGARPALATAPAAASAAAALEVGQLPSLILLHTLSLIRLFLCEGVSSRLRNDGAIALSDTMLLWEIAFTIAEWLKQQAKHCL